MKKFSHYLGVTFVLILLLSVSSQAADRGIAISIDGEILSATGTAIDGHTLLPVKDICEALGAHVIWDGTEQSVTVAKMLYSIRPSGEYHAEYRTIKMVIGQTEVRVNGLISTPLEICPQIIDDKTMVPVRAVSEWLGATVKWNEETQTVEIEKALNSSFADARMQRAKLELAERNAIDAALGDSTIIEVPSEWISEDKLSDKGSLTLIDYIPSRSKGFYQTGMASSPEAVYEVPDYPEGFKDSDGRGVFSNIRMKVENGVLYFSQDDLIVAGLISEPLEFKYVMVES